MFDDSLFIFFFRRKNESLFTSVRDDLAKITLSTSKIVYVTAKIEIPWWFAAV